MTRADRPGKGWLTKQELAAVFDVSVQQFDRSYRRFAGSAAVRELDGKLFFHGRSILEEWGKSQAPAPQAASADPLLDGGDSPALEEYRRHKARQAKVVADEAEALAIPRNELEPVLLKGAGVMRRAGEVLARRYGNDAADVHNEAVEQWIEVCRVVLERNAGNAGAGGDRDEDAAAPHDTGVRRAGNRHPDGAVRGS